MGLSGNTVRPHISLLASTAARQKASVIHVSGDIAVESVIEVGCGAGGLSPQPRLLDYARKYLATDLSLAVLRFLNQRAARASFRLCACSALSLCVLSVKARLR
jgi:hypothetical protein